jgi:hypothetical protein
VGRIDFYVLSAQETLARLVFAARLTEQNCRVILPSLRQCEKISQLTEIPVFR